VARPWLRLYRSALNSPKVQQLGLEGVGFWANCLMAADDDGYLPEALAWSLRLSEDVAAKWLDTLARHGLVTRDSHGNGHAARYRMHDWETHQHQSDTDPTAAERKRRQRQKAQETANRVTENVTRDASVTVTRTDTDTDTEKNREERKREEREQVRSALCDINQPASKAKKPERGSRWPVDAVVPDEWQQAAAEARQRAGQRPVDMRHEVAKFCHYWTSPDAKNPTKKDWRLAFINWILKANGAANGHAKPSGQHGATSTAGEVFGRLYATARAQREAAGE
jgi:hypothetical protein